MKFDNIQQHAEDPSGSNRKYSLRQSELLAIIKSNDFNDFLYAKSFSLSLSFPISRSRCIGQGGGSI